MVKADGTGALVLETRVIKKDRSGEDGITTCACVCMYMCIHRRDSAKEGESSEIRVESRWLSGYLILTAAPQHLTSLAPSNAP